MFVAVKLDNAAPGREPNVIGVVETMAESFFATPESELLDRTSFLDPRSSQGQAHHHARRAIFELIEGWYNPHRRHRGLGQQSLDGLREELPGSCMKPRPSTRISHQPPAADADLTAATGVLPGGDP